jgi:hypothetical protein
MNVELFKNSIHIRTSPEGEVFNELDMEDLPDNIGISYNNVSGFMNLFQSEDGQTLINKAKLGELTLHIFPTDSVGITFEESEFLIENEETLKNANINFYQSWYNPSINYNLYFGSTIHSALDYLVSASKTETFPTNVKEKHFLTLNNHFRPDRVDLYDFYEELSSEDKSKFLCSFNFNEVFLEEEIFNSPETIGEYIYKDNIVNYYKNCLLEIISESSVISISEKSYKPILTGTPFIYWSLVTEQSYFPQLAFFDELGIDVNYFNIDYVDKFAVRAKIEELLSLSKEELLSTYNDAFVKAAENKQILINHITTIEQKIIAER